VEGCQVREGGGVLGAGQQHKFRSRMVAAAVRSSVASPVHVLSTEVRLLAGGGGGAQGAGSCEGQTKMGRGVAVQQWHPNIPVPVPCHWPSPRCAWLCHQQYLPMAAAAAAAAAVTTSIAPQCPGCVRRSCCCE
jgi:hypothetical protein